MAMESPKYTTVFTYQEYRDGVGLSPKGVGGGAGSPSLNPPLVFAIELADSNWVA